VSSGLTYIYEIEYDPVRTEDKEEEEKKGYCVVLT
jgi:hypothetical protein